MSEKLRTQQMNNDLEKLTHELEKIGINKERLLHDESSDDRYHKRSHTSTFTVRTTIRTIILKLESLKVTPNKSVLPLSWPNDI